MAVERKFLSPLEAGRYLGLSPRTLSRHRRADTGPAFHLFGGKIGYLQADLDRWAASRRRPVGDVGEDRSRADDRALQPAAEAAGA